MCLRSPRKVPLIVHPASAAVFQPPFRSMPCTPTGDEKRKVVCRACR